MTDPVTSQDDNPGAPGAWWNAPHAVRVLEIGFVITLLIRLYYPIADSPLDHLFSDPGRHWRNGGNLFNPDLMGASDPIVYQVWIYIIQKAGSYDDSFVLIATGLLCALQPVGWFLALRELVPRGLALLGGIIIGLMPSLLVTYGHFMTETLLMPLMAFAFWATFRAWKNGSVALFALAAALWLLAGFTRLQALPIGGIALFTIWIVHSRKFVKASIGVLMLWYLALATGLHTKSALNFFAPAGNLYLNQAYGASGKKKIIIQLMRGDKPAGSWYFVSPSFANSTFEPFSDWRSSRTGEFTITIDVLKGAADWKTELARVDSERTIPAWRLIAENFTYLSFGHPWPDNWPPRPLGAISVWTRWVWLPLLLVVAYGVFRRRFRGIEWLLPTCALGTFILMGMQKTGVMESRYRKPLDPVAIAAVLVMGFRSRKRTEESTPGERRQEASASAPAGWQGN